MDASYSTPRAAALSRSDFGEGIVYTWKFVEDTCGVDSPTQFARATDPSVGEHHNPWSDWHDDEKLLRLAGQEMCILHKQLWNQGWYVWYALARRAEHPHVQAPQPFLDLEACEAANNTPVLSLPLSRLAAAEAQIRVEPSGAVSVTTTENQYFYALVSDQMSKAQLSAVPDKLLIDIDLQEGMVSAGILDTEKEQMAFARVIGWQGPHRHHFSLKNISFPDHFQIVISNHQQNAAARSVFLLHELCLLHRRQEPVQDGQTSGST